MDAEPIAGGLAVRLPRHEVRSGQLVIPVSWLRGLERIKGLA